MKFIYAIAFFLCATQCVRAQNEQIMIERRGDTVVVTNKDVNENCAARFQIDVSVQGNAVTITETDTVWQKAHCMCHFDLSAFLTGLPVGTYSVEVYRDYLKKFNYPEDKQILANDATFDVLQPNPAPLSVRAFQSECYQPSGTQSAQAANVFSLSIFPNPASADVQARVNLARTERLMLLLFDERGNEAGKPLEFDALPGAHEFTFPAATFTHIGMYYCAVVINSAVKMQAITIVR